MISNHFAYLQDAKEKMTADEFDMYQKRLFKMEEERMALKNKVSSNTKSSLPKCPKRIYKYRKR